MNLPQVFKTEPTSRNGSRRCSTSKAVAENPILASLVAEKGGIKREIEDVSDDESPSWKGMKLESSDSMSRSGRRDNFNTSFANQFEEFVRQRNGSSSSSSDKTQKMATVTNMDENAKCGVVSHVEGSPAAQKDPILTSLFTSDSTNEKDESKFTAGKPGSSLEPWIGTVSNKQFGESSIFNAVEEPAEPNDEMQSAIESILSLQHDNGQNDSFDSNFLDSMVNDFTLGNLPEDELYTTQEDDLEAAINSIM